METQGNYRVIVSERAKQMLVYHAAFLAQVSLEAAERLTAEFERRQILWRSCPRDARGFLGSIFPEIPTDSSSLKNARCSFFKS